MAASSQELRYMIVFTTEGKAQLVEATEELKEQQSAHKLTRVSADEYAKGVQNLKKQLANLSNEVIDVNEFLKRNSLELEKARLEYETGAISSDKYTERLESLNAELSRIQNPTKGVVTRQRQLHKELSRVKGGMDQTGKSTATTNNLLIALTRGAQDAQFGMMGMANNLQQSAELAASASQQMGGMKNVVMGLASSFMNPATGLIIGVTAITTAWQLAESGAFDFSTQIENLDEITEGYVDTIDQLISQMNELVFGDEDFFSTEQLEQRLIMQKAIQTQEEQRLKVLKQEYKELNDIAVNSPGDLDVDRFNEVQREMQFIEGFLETTKEKQLELEGEILVKKRAMNNEDLARIARGNEFVELLEQEDKILQDWADNDITGQIASDIEKMNESMAEGEDPFAMLGDPSDRLKELRAQMQADLKFEQELENQRIQILRSSGQQELAFKMELDRELKELRNNELIDEQRKEEMKWLIIEEYAWKEIELEEKKAAMKKQLREAELQQEQMLQQQKFDNQMMAVQGTLGLLGTVFEGSKRISKGIAIADGLAASIAALKNPPGPPWTIPISASILATSVKRASQIGNLSLNNPTAGGAGGGGGNPNPVASFRGIQSDAVNGRDERKMTGTLRLEDGAGKFLTKLQFEQDQSDSGGYVGG